MGRLRRGYAADYNRAAVPLIEIVTEPDFRSAGQVCVFLQTLRAQYDAAQSQEEKAQIADAVRLGLAAMDGREVPAL